MSTASSVPLRNLQPYFTPKIPNSETPEIERLIASLGLLKHIEGGYFVETDRDSFRIPNPFLHSPVSSLATSITASQSVTRNASTTIYYFLSPESSIGAFHRNKGRTIHTLHWGRGRYVIIHADEVSGNGEKARVETFVVGKDVASGEKLQWIVEGGKYKASFLLPDEESCGGEPRSQGLLISEVGHSFTIMYGNFF
jgi:predicted cupin superfamily sugar epimerase